MKLPYENQLIGAFVFALGRSVGRKSNDPSSKPFSVNLFQQTPLDGEFSDLILGDERCLVIEFKREPGTLGTESEKWGAAAIARFVSDESARKASIRAHLVVYGQTTESSVDLRFCFYADVLNATQQPNLNRGSASDVINRLVNPAPKVEERPGLPPGDLMRYLDALHALRKGGDARKGSGGSAWLGVTEGKAGFRIVAAASLEQLLGHEIEPGQQYDRTLERDRENDRGHGFGR